MIKLNIVPYESHFLSIMKVLKEIEKEKKGAVCYISLNKTGNFLKKFLSTMSGFKDTLIIDGVTLNLTLEKNDKIENSELINPQNLIEELSKIQEKYLYGGGFKHIIFDSISTLYAYNPEDKVNDYIAKLVNRFSLLADVYFLCNKSHFEKITNYLEKKGIVVLSGEAQEYILKCPIDSLFDMVHQLEKPKEKINQDKLQRLHDNAHNVYKMIEKDDLAKSIKHKIYKKCYEEINKIEG